MGEIEISPINLKLTLSVLEDNYEESMGKSIYYTAEPLSDA